MTLVALRGGAVSLLVDASGPGLPRVLPWGADLGARADAVALAARRPVALAALDVAVAPSLVPEAATGWRGRPGLAGWSPAEPAAPSRGVSAGARRVGRRGAGRRRPSRRSCCI